MTEIESHDLSYAHAGTEMLGRLSLPRGQGALPGLLVLPGAAGLTPEMAARAEGFARAGYAALAVDLWGGRRVLTDPGEFGPALGAMTADRAAWMGRLDAARAALAARPEVDARRIGAVGYCFGGTSVLEYLRTGGGARAVASVHGGLDHAGSDWSAASPGAAVLILSGAADPLAGPSDLARLTGGLSAAGVAWELDLYGGAKHAFTEPDRPGTPPFAGYDATADRRAGAALARFFAETLAA